MSLLQDSPGAGIGPVVKNFGKVLVVDDTVATRYAIGRHLIRSGFEVIEAGTGAEALKLAKQEQPSLITLDIHLPDLLGFDVARKLKEDPATAHIPILHLTASFVTDKDKVLGLEGGADSYLTHPVDPPVLIATIRALLRLGKADEEVRESERRFRALANTLPQMTWMAGAEGFPEFVNERWIDYSGFTPKRDERDFWAPFVHPSDLPEIRESWMRALRTGESLETEIRLRRQDGVYRWHWVRAVPIMNERDEVMRWIGGCTDIDEKKRLEVAMLAAKDEAESASRAKSQFLANMSHEIRTPLGVILGFSEIAMEQKNCSEELRTVLATIRRNAIHLASLVDDVLDVSKVEAGRLELLNRAVPLKTIIEGIRSAVEPRAKEKGIGFRMQGLSALPKTIQTDETRLLQILINLATNAVKFTDEGEVCIDFKLVKRDANGRMDLMVDVTDTGIGISPEQRSKLFQVFSQVDPSTTRRFGGSGLGLALSRRLAEAMGGSLDLAESQAEKGSTFRMILPIGVRDEKDLRSLEEILRGDEIRKEQKATSKYDFGGLKVLVIEDSIDNQKLITRFLSSVGAEIMLADNGEEGLQLASEQPFDMVLMDIQMPEMDGFEATRHLRDAGFEQPIIALTAHALKGDRERCLSAGCTDYLTKPIVKERLYEMLQRNWKPLLNS